MIEGDINLNRERWRRGLHWETGAGLAGFTHIKHDISSLRLRDATPEPGNGGRLFVLQNRSLQIIGARKEDSGKYVCVAISTEGNSTVTALLDVKGTSIA